MRRTWMAFGICAAAMLAASACKKSSTTAPAPAPPTATPVPACYVNSMTCTPSATRTPTPTLTLTDTRTPTVTRTFTGTSTPTLSPTDTPTNLGGFTSTHTETSTATFTPTFTVPVVPTDTAVPGAIVWGEASVNRMEGMILMIVAPGPPPTPGTPYPTITPIILTSLQSAYLTLRVNGQPVTDASVGLTGSDSSFRILPYTGLTTGGGVTYAAYGNSNISGGDFQYAAGVTYTFITLTSAGNAQASIVAPGGITHAPDGSQSTWATDGDFDNVNVVDLNYTNRFSTVPSGDMDPPVGIPVTAYSICGVNSLITNCTSSSNSITGATLVNPVSASDWLGTSVTVTANCTVVPTNTPSGPPSPPGPMPTPTPTFTPV